MKQIYNVCSAQNLEESSVGGVDDALSGHGDPSDTVESGLALLHLGKVSTVDQTAALVAVGCSRGGGCRAGHGRAAGTASARGGCCGCCCCSRRAAFPWEL